VTARTYVNRIATALPPHEAHGKFIDFASRMLQDERRQRLFQRMVERAQIERRFSVIDLSRDDAGFDSALSASGAFPGIRARMELFERYAPELAMQAVMALQLTPKERPTHVIVTTCTGLHAPGIDLEIVRRLGLGGSVERTVVGFMGCQAAINGLKLADHIVRSEPRANVLLVNIELCTLHLQATGNLDELLSFLIFADGCAASLISAAPEGIAIMGFQAALIPESWEQMTWRLGVLAFDMVLSGAVPGLIGRHLPGIVESLRARFADHDFALWAVHPGGRSVLDAVEAALALPPAALAASREVLRSHGNMSSPTVMFVLRSLMQSAASGQGGVAMAFGPGLTAETMVFQTVGQG
jgi:predicted naringenin-chalcone synthase